MPKFEFDTREPVSTHSRPKAAGVVPSFRQSTNFCFNTQPPEGGWHDHRPNFTVNLWFQHTAARRRLDLVVIMNC